MSIVELPLSKMDIDGLLEAAVQAGAGGRVDLPAGTVEVDNEQMNPSGSVSFNGAGRGLTFIKQIHPAPFVDIFNPTGGSLPLYSNMTLQGLVEGSDDHLNGCAFRFKDVLNWCIYHCDLIDFPQYGVKGSNNSKGLFAQSSVKQFYKDAMTAGRWGYGVGVSSTNYWSWDEDLTHFLGLWDALNPLYPSVCVEDSDFYKCRHAVTSNQLGWYIFRRNNVFQDYNSAVDVHGSLENAAGGRGGAVYYNIIQAPLGAAFRGGSGVICHNDVSQCSTGVQVQKDIAGTPLRPLNKLYIWDNTGTFQAKDYVENQDYFLREPTVPLDGFGYVPLGAHPLLPSIIEPPPPQPPPARTYAARSIGPLGVPFAVIDKILRPARNKLISDEVHKKLHPLV